MLSIIHATLDAYGITYDTWFSEKTLHEGGQIAAALEKLKKNGYLFEAEGALWFTSTKFGDDKDRVVKKSNGEYTYAAADIAYILSKIERGAEKLILVLGQDHHSYVVRLKGIMQALGYQADQLDVILYQLVTIRETGELVRMSKRAGTFITLQEVIDAVGKDIARFFYLHRKADAHLDFDIDLALKHTDENPVYYLQYAYVRIQSIIKKAQEAGFNPAHGQELTELQEAEKLLLKNVLTLKHILHVIVHQYQTHLLTYYVLDIAKLVHQYYNAQKVIDPSNPSQTKLRLAILSIVKEAIELCCNLMGISTPDRM